MTGRERVRNMLLGKEIDRQPIYGWLKFNLTDEISERFGSVENFEDKYEFDMAHIFGCPQTFDKELIAKIREENGELTPDMLLDADIFRSPDNMEEYEQIRKELEFHKAKGRFCYMQSPGFFEKFNSVFGIQEHLMWLVLYPEELGILYKKQAQWTKRFAEHCIDMGMDMIHLSDDWGAQKDLLFNPDIWKELIYPNLKDVVDFVHSKGAFCSLHSDGCVARVADGIAEIGFDMVHPWQENAGMSHDLYKEKYADKFAMLGGICVQSALGVIHGEALENEIRRVFANLKGQRWCCCTSHFVQKHCTIDELVSAYDLIYKLARE